MSGNIKCTFVKNKTHLMILNLFIQKKKAFFFESNEWRFDEQKGLYCLRLPFKKYKITCHTKLYLYKQQGERYIFVSHGHEIVDAREVIYYSQLPFSGKVRIK